ncbi:MAG TPA: SDR family oxidoreductase [Flavisolibacter sp.]|jgi:NAD(P)-dependent dehydrogenase (short-subunit alcohol dehydrogenase family)|nr:SDR family oxidoreductase [Flavisolibacter sp.]
MKQKVIFITGTNSGFGWLHVHTLSKAGHKIYATVRDLKGRNAAKAAELERLANVTVVEAELTDAASVKAAVDMVIAAEGRIDVLVNNAGNFTSGIAETFTDEDVDFLFDVHFKGTWRTIKQVLPHMRKQGEGLIINTSSVLGRFSSPFMTFYNSAKFAVEGLSEGLRYELRPLGIDVALIQPGAFPTEIFGKAGQGSDSSVINGYGELAKVPEQIGVGIGQLFETAKPDPQTVANAVLGLIELPKGKRPLRTVVDAITGSFVETANERVREGHRDFVSAFGLHALLD